MAFLRRHRGLVAATVLIGIALAVFVLVWFQPQKLFIDREVNEAAPVAAATPDGEPASPNATADAGPRTIKQATFVSLSHDAKGDVSVIETGAERILRFENFSTENGPDVLVYLSTEAPDTANDDAFARDFVDLGSLKGNVGDQNYDIPSGTDLEKYSTVVVWCRRFNVAFAAAQLA